MTHARVRDVMTTKVIAVPQRTPYKQIAMRLHESGVSAFPVTDDDGKVVGVVSATDLLAKEAFAVAEIRASPGCPPAAPGRMLGSGPRPTA